jgi:putative peptidoglycan lipid II flippase
MKTPQWQQISKLWKSSTSNSVNRQIFSAAIVVAMGTIFVKVSAIVKELVVAYQFGTATELDAYLIALTVPSFLISIIAGSFNSALIPTYIKVREQEGIKSAQKLFAGATIWSIGLLLIATLLMLAGIPLYLPMLTNGFSPDKLALTYHLTWAIAPMLLLSGIGTIWGAVLNAGERFALVALVPMITSMITMVLLWSFKSLGVFNLTIGMVCGQLIEMLIIGIALQRQGFSLRLKWHGFTTHLKEVANQYVPAMMGALLMCSTGLVDQSMAAMLPSGSVAALSYGNRIVTLPIVIASTALSTAVMPYFSKMVATDDWQNIRNSLRHYLLIIFAASVPLTGAIVFCSEPIVRMLLQRGSFNANDTQIVAQIQSMFAIQIPFYIGGILLVRLISAMRKNQILIVGSACNLIINIGLNFLFMRWLGVAGIALSTSFVYVFSFSFLLFFVVRNLKSIDSLGLTPTQQAKIEQLAQSKFDRINTILTPQQRQAFKQIEMQRPSPQQRRNGVNLSADQKTELAAMRRDYMEQFRSILTPAQQVQLQTISDWERGISLAQIKNLLLTPSQTEKTTQLWLEEYQQIETVLTSVQREQMQAKQSLQKSIEQAWENLNLTPEQKIQMRAIRQEHKQQLNSILTPEQQSKIKNGDGRYQIRRRSIN